MSNRIRVCLDGAPSAADSGWPPPFATFRSRCSTLICTTKSTILFSCSAAAACRARLFVEANVRTSASHWALSSIEPARARASPQRQASELWQQQRAARPYFRQPSNSVLASAVGCEGRRLRFPDTFRDGGDYFVSLAVVRSSGPLGEDGLHRSSALLICLVCTHFADQILVRTGHRR